MNMPKRNEALMLIKNKLLCLEESIVRHYGCEILCRIFGKEKTYSVAGFTYNPRARVTQMSIFFYRDSGEVFSFINK